MQNKAKHVIVGPQPELVGSAMQKSCTGLGSDAKATAQANASRLNTKIMWFAILILVSSNFFKPIEDIKFNYRKEFEM